MSLSEATKQIIKSTAPVLAEYGPIITTTMYKHMFTNHPELKTIFNQQHQIVKPGEKFATQPKALAQAVHAYAANIDNLSVLSSAIERIAEKHVSTNVKAHHYPIVGKHLLGAIKEVLGDAATPEIVNAWGEGYQFLADIFIKRETDIANERAKMNGGWEDFREFVISKKVQEATDICSFHLIPKDNGKVMNPWKEGQYICIRTEVEGVGLAQRNYSISCPVQDEKIRITVKREQSPQDISCPDGLVSSKLHSMKEGDIVNITVPCGDFYVEKPKDDNPLIFLALGTGVTPIYPMVNYAVNNISNKIYVLQGARNEESLCLGNEFLQLKEKYNDKISYEAIFKSPKESKNTPTTMDFNNVWSRVPHNGHYYFSGPGKWMESIASNLKSNNISQNNIHYEFFGPTLAI